MAYRQQVVLDTGEGLPGVPGTGTFTVMNLLKVSTTQTFYIGGERFKLGKRRDQFRQPAALRPRRLHPAVYSLVTPSPSSKTNQMTGTRNRV
jgi:hypothetical protein